MSTLPDSGLVKRPEAARFCRMSVQTFDAHVRPRLTEKRVGRLLFFLRSELEEWAASPEAGSSANVRRVTRTQSVSGALAERLKDPRAQAIRLRLVEKRPASTPTKCVERQSHELAGAVSSQSRSS